MPECTPGAAQLLPLLDHLAEAGYPTADAWRGWQCSQINGGANNLLYRASDGDSRVAIKFTVRDDRDRAGREHEALLALQRAGVDVAPRPLLLSRDRYRQPVVVATWLDGEISAAPPASPDEWRLLLDHLEVFHAVSPSLSSPVQRPAVLTMASAAGGLTCIHEQVERSPAQARPRELLDLVGRVDATDFSDWPDAPLALCRCDPNPTNFVRRSPRWASVDWENAGWGDPAFELAEMLVHPAYLSIAEEQRRRVIDVCCRRSDDRMLRTRIGVYTVLMLVWWVARFARAIYEVPRGLDRRMVERPDNWQEDAVQKYERYLRMAHRSLDLQGNRPGS